MMSRTGKGSTFAFYIRARRISLHHEADRGDLSNPANANISDPKGSALPDTMRNLLDPKSTTLPRYNQQFVTTNKRFSILVVEDNIVNRLVLKKQLTKLGFVIHEANHGEEALSFLQETRFMHGKEQSGQDLTLVLMDLEMPVMDGLTCVRRIRALQESKIFTRHVPVIAVTANARREQIDTALAAGMDSVVCKPFRIPELVKQMEDLLVNIG